MKDLLQYIIPIMAIISACIALWAIIDYSKLQDKLKELDSRNDLVDPTNSELDLIEQSMANRFFLILIFAPISLIGAFYLSYRLGFM